MPDAYVVREMIAAEQREFADLLRSLTSEDWQRASLCRGWSVHEVVIHIAIHSHTRDTQRFFALARVGFSMDRLHQPERARKPDELIAWLESPATLAGDHNLRVQLSELIIHQQDVRRPLGATRVIPPERLAVVLDYGISRFGGINVAGARRRAKGLRLVATDMSWAAGTGPEVCGAGEALFMALNGRAAALADLSGAGVETLSTRMKP
jgi:uncharacterized protein (TIGR03083 family)